MVLLFIQVVFGRWLIEGYPKVILFDIGSAMFKLDDWKQEIWTTAHIGIPWADREAMDAVLFGFMTAHFMDEVWMASMYKVVIRWLIMLDWCICVIYFNILV